MRLGALLLAAAVTALVTAGAPVRDAPAQESLRIAAVVNDEIISVHDLERRVDLLLATSNMEQAEGNRARVAAHVLRLLIEEKLKVQEARRLNVAVTREELDDALAQVAGQLGVQPQQLPGMLASRAVSPQSLIDQLEAEIAWIKAVQRKAKGEVIVSDEEIEARLDRLESEAGSLEYRLAEIFLPVDDPAREPEIQSLTQRLMDELRQGSRFRTLARNFSQGAAAAVGGDLGWLRIEQLDPDLQQAAASMSPGQALGPLRSQLGYHILFLIDRRTIQPPDRGRVMVNLSQLVLPLSPNAPDQEIREQIIVARELAAEAETCEELVEIGEDSGSTLSGNLGTLELRRLDEPLQRIVRPLRAGDQSEPFATNTDVVVLMMCDRREEDVNDQLRERIRRALLNERLAVAARRMLRDLQREAFVDVRI